MKKGIFVPFFCGLLCCCVVVNAQVITQQQKTKFKTNNHRNIFRSKGVLALKNRKVTFNKKSFKLDLPKHKESKTVYLKLKYPVTKSLKKKLKKYDIELNNYVSDNTFAVQLNEKKLKKLQQFFSIDGFADIEPVDKISKSLYKGNCLASTIISL